MNPKYLYNLALMIFIFVGNFFPQAFSEKFKKRNLIAPGRNDQDKITQFIHISRLLSISRENNRNLIIAYKKSDQGGNICSIFEFPPEISCLRKGNVKCPKDNENALTIIKSPKKNAFICDDELFINEIKERQQDLIFRIKNSIPVIYSDLSLKLIKQLDLASRSVIDPKSIFIINIGSLGNCNELNSLCMQKSSELLIPRIIELADSLNFRNSQVELYITNEELISSTFLDLIRKKGILLFSSIFKENSQFVNTQSRFLFELNLMLTADKFYGVGISLVNDFVEHQRSLLGKEYCSTALIVQKYNLDSELISGNNSISTYCNLRNLNKNYNSIIQSNQDSASFEKLPNKNSTDQRMASYIMNKIALYYIWIITSWRIQVFIFVLLILLVIFLIKSGIFIGGSSMKSH